MPLDDFLGSSEVGPTRLCEKRDELSRQAQLLELAYEPILVRDMSDKVVFWNDAAERVYGFSKSQAIGKVSHELLKTRFPLPLPEILSELRTRGHWSGELIHVTADGQRRAVESRWVLQRDEDSNPIAVLETNFDVSDRKRKEEQLRSLSAIVESSYDAIIGKTSDGTITSWNTGAKMLYGYEAEEMIGQPISILIPEDHPDEEIAILQRILEGGVFDQYETVRVRKDGSLVEVSLRISPIYDEDRNITGASIIARDITQRKQTERALMQTEKLASVGRMAATMAHEINNPLAAAINSVYLASMDPTLSEKGRAALATAEQELARVAHLTRQTLGFYRDSSNPSTVRLEELIEGVLNLYRPRLANKNIKVQRRFAKGSEVYVVEGEVRQVIANLIANSIDAVEKNGLIQIRTSRAVTMNEGRPMVRLTVADRGIGIRKENLPHLFEPFFTTKEAFGTGLGLWVSKELVHKQEGRIRVRSRLGEGTIFAVWLPSERRAQGAQHNVRVA